MDRHTSRSIVCTALLVATAAILTACGSDSSGPSGLTPSQVNGVWTVTGVPRPAICGNQTATTSVTMTLAFQANGETGDVGSSWRYGSSSLQRLAQGQVDYASGAVSLHLWGVPNESALRLTGTFAGDGSFTGLLREPAPGYDTIFLFGTCEWDVTGQRL